MQSICRTMNLTKKYNNVSALDGVNLHIKKGAIYGLIGENGAGKTTLIKSVAGLIHPTSGDIELFDSSTKLHRMQGRVGYTIENPALYMDMTAAENLKVFCLQKGISSNSIGELLKLLKLSDTGKKKVKMFSLGMKQRLILAAALLNTPDFLILDEPLNGLDPTGILELRFLLQELNHKQGITILLSSHILSELHKLATHYGIMHKGKLIEEITAEELDKKCEKHIRISVSDADAAIQILKREFDIESICCIGRNTIEIYQYLDLCAKFNKALVLNNIDVMEIGVRGNSLETYFTSVIGGVSFA